MKNQKLIIFSFVFLLGAILISNAQESSFGLRGGLNLSNLYLDDVDDENSKIGFHAGFYSRNQLNDILYLQPEILFSLKGTETNYANLLFRGKYRFNLSYVDIPVLLGINIGENFSLQAGPYISYLMSVKIKNVDSDGSTNGVTELDRDDFNTIDYGLVAALGFNFEAGSLSLRYNYGLQEIGNSNSTFNSGGKNSVLQLSLGFDL